MRNLRLMCSVIKYDRNFICGKFGPVQPKFHLLTLVKVRRKISVKLLDFNKINKQSVKIILIFAKILDLTPC